MLVATQAIVISALRYAEADLIVKLYTKKSGLKSYLLRSVLKSKKGKFRASQFQPLTQLDIVANHKDKGNLEYLKEVKLSTSYNSLHLDIQKSTVVLFLAEFLKEAIREEEPNPHLFNYIIEALQWFDAHKSANFHLLFMLNLTKYFGFYPDTSNQQYHYFNLQDGIFQSESTNPYCFEGDSINNLKELLGITFDDLKVIKLNQNTRLGVLSVLLTYYQLHLHGFKTPKSLTVLKEIFS